MAGPRPGEPGVPWWERWRPFADFTGVATAAAWDLAPEPVLARGAPDTVERAMADTLTAYQHASALDVIGMRGEGKLREGLQRLLQLASVSHGHLSRSMSKHFGCRPVEFVNRTRLSHAAMLLATTADPIGRVAERSGFSRQSYFRPALSCHHGQTPRAYREQARRAAVPKEP